VLGDGLGAVLVQHARVVVAQGADEHGRTAAAQRGGNDPGVFQYLPGQLQNDPLPRVHRGGLARRDAGEPAGQPHDDPVTRHHARLPFQDLLGGCFLGYSLRSFQDSGSHFHRA
jgi:hypothetical protein